MAIPLLYPQLESSRTSAQATVQPTSKLQWLAAAGLLAAIVWVFLPTLISLERMWRVDPDQAHGYLVVPFVLYLIWSGRHREADGEEIGSPIWGLLMLIVGLGIRFAGIYVYLDWLQAAALVPCLLGIGMIVWGPGRAISHWGALAFLLFMIPLPYRLATGLAYPLQRTASICSTYMLETIGFYASCIGTTIHIGDHALDVVAACSGMKILVTFFALSVAFALCNPQRPWWERLAMIIAAIPVALAANVIRIITTAVLYQVADPELAKTVFHDWAGYLMMPVALLLMSIWTWILRTCVVVDDVELQDRTRLVPGI